MGTSAQSYTTKKRYCFEISKWFNKYESFRQGTFVDYAKTTLDYCFLYRNSRFC